jgi:DNA-binding MarR family transcriptional regulator
VARTFAAYRELHHLSLLSDDLRRIEVSMLVGMTAMAPTRTEPDLSFLLDHGSHVLRTRMAAALAEIGLTARMHCVLVHALEGERTQIQLAEIGDMDKTTMVVTVDALEKAGLAERRPSRTDRRARIIAVTEEGARVAARSQEIVDGVHEEALATLPRDEREVFLRAMNRLVTGHLARPAENPAPARRARQRGN